MDGQRKAGWYQDSDLTEQGSQHAIKTWYDNDQNRWYYQLYQPDKKSVLGSRHDLSIIFWRRLRFL